MSVISHTFIEFRHPSNLKRQHFSSVPDNKEFHGPSVGNPYLYCVLSNVNEQPLSCPPSMSLVTTTKNGKAQKYLLRGDSEGFISMWSVPDLPIDEIKDMQAANSAPKCENMLKLKS